MGFNHVFSVMISIMSLDCEEKKKNKMKNKTEGINKKKRRNDSGNNSTKPVK